MKKSIIQLVRNECSVFSDVVICVCILPFIFASCKPASEDFSVADLYVSVDGCDTWSGRLSRPAADGTDGPLATLAAARDKVRLLKQADAQKDFLVMIGGGTYRLTETVVFSLDDSAPQGGSITYAAYPGQYPVFSSGVPVANWQKPASPVMRAPAHVREKLWVANLPEGVDRCLTLYDGTTRLVRARMPEFTPSKFLSRGIAHPLDRFEFPPGAMKNWPDLKNAEMAVIPSCDYEMGIFPLASVDEANHIATLAVPASRPIGKVKYMDKTLWVENLIEAIDEPGEWAVDFDERKIYYWPYGDRPGERIVVPALTELIRIEGEIDYDGPTDRTVAGLTFKGLTFSHAERYPWSGYTGWDLQHHWEMFDMPTAAVRLRGADHCTFQACRFFATGGTGIRLDLTCRNNRIIDNEIGHVGAVGILLCGYGPGTKDTNHNNEVSNNWVHNTGELYLASPAIFVWQSGSNRITNNHIRHTPYSGIVVSGRITTTTKYTYDGSGRTVRWHEISPSYESLADSTGWVSWYDREKYLHARKNLVMHNDIANVLEVMGDGNGIYISGTGGENHIYQNYIHHIDGPGLAGGIRCDNDQWETIVEGNIVYHIRSVQCGISTTEMNHIVNNIVVDILPSCRPVPQDRLVHGYIIVPSDFPVDGAKIQRNILFSFRKDYQPIMMHGSFSDGTYDRLKDTQTDYNLYWCTEDPDWGLRNVLLQREQFGLELNTQIADPMFIDLGKGDLRLRPESPAWKMGFVETDMNQVGLHANHPFYPGKIY